MILSIIWLTILKNRNSYETQKVCFGHHHFFECNCITRTNLACRRTAICQMGKYFLSHRQFGLFYWFVGEGEGLSVSLEKEFEFECEFACEYGERVWVWRKSLSLNVGMEKKFECGYGERFWGLEISCGYIKMKMMNLLNR